MGGRCHYCRVEVWSHNKHEEAPFMADELMDLLNWYLCRWCWQALYFKDGNWERREHILKELTDEQLFKLMFYERAPTRAHAAAEWKRRNVDA